MPIYGLMVAQLLHSVYALQLTNKLQLSTVLSVSFDSKQAIGCWTSVATRAIGGSS